MIRSTAWTIDTGMSQTDMVVPKRGQFTLAKTDEWVVYSSGLERLSKVEKECPYSMSV